MEWLNNEYNHPPGIYRNVGKFWNQRKENKITKQQMYLSTWNLPSTCVLVWLGVMVGEWRAGGKEEQKD